MSFLIQNIDAGNVLIDDLGLELVPGEIYDFTISDAAADIAKSGDGGDLETQMTAGLIVVKDPLDGVTNLTPLSVALDCVRSANDSHFRIRGGRAVDVVFDNSGTDNAGVTLQTAVVNNSGKVRWLNKWGEGTYEKHDMVIDGTWTMIANTQTTDRAGPQATDAPEETPAVDSVFTTASNSSVIKMVHHFSITNPGWINDVRILVPSWNLDAVSRVTLFNLTTNTSVIINNPILNSGNWVIVRNQNTFVSIGDQFEVWFEFFNSSAANSVDGGWLSSINTGTPALSTFRIDSAIIPTVINIDHTDLDTDNRSSELDGVTVGSIILIAETDDPTRNVEVEVTSVDTVPASYTGYGVSLVQLGSKPIRDSRTCTVNIDVPITQPSQYSRIADYYLGITNQPTFATVTTKLYYGNVQQADVDDAYGIGVTFHAALISPDWDFISSGASGSATGGAGAGEINTASNIGGGDGIFAQKNGVNLEFKSLTNGTGILITPVSTGSPPFGNEIQITNTLPNVDQNLWATFVADTGSTSANTTTDTLTVNGTTDQITTTIVGDVLAAALAPNTIIPGNEAIGIPSGTTAERPTTPAIGDMRFNTTTGVYEAWDGTQWVIFGSPAGTSIRELTGGQLAHLQGTTQIPYDNSPPLVTEGTQFFSHSITTESTGARIILWFSTIVSVTNANRIATISVFRDSVLIGVTAVQMPSTNAPVTTTFIVVDTPGTIGTYTYSGRIGLSASATWRIGGFTSNANYGGAANTNNQYVLMRVE